MPFTKLVDMELADEDKLDACMPIPCDQPDYPWGLRICLTEKELEKLGLPIPQNGDYLDMRAVACVTSVTTEDRESGQTCRVELQIEKIACENEDDEAKEIENGRTTRRRSLYSRRTA